MKLFLSPERKRESYPIKKFFYSFFSDAESVDYSYGRSCIRPYRKIGPQCLFFSRPEPLWDIDVTWHGAYLNFYDAVAVCRKHGGDLAGKILDYGAALRYCQSSRGGCAPSLLWRDNKCFQWSPIDGTEAEIPCKRWEVTMRYICEMNDY